MCGPVHHYVPVYSSVPYAFILKMVFHHIDIILKMVLHHIDIVLKMVLSHIGVLSVKKPSADVFTFEQVSRYNQD